MQRTLPAADCLIDSAATDGVSRRRWSVHSDTQGLWQQRGTGTRKSEGPRTRPALRSGYLPQPKKQAESREGLAPNPGKLEG